MITIIDYGLGNIKAFVNIYNQLNIKCSIASNKKELEDSTKLILPGVGSFDHAMSLLNKSGMRDSIENKVIDRKIPILGICVGMQILANSSEEGDMEGLGFIEGHVKKFLSEDLSGLPLPHMGWNNVQHNSSEDLFLDIKDKSRFYFLHSFYFECKKNIHAIASSHYGKDFKCAIKKDNIFGVQFHPEKSHNCGTKLLKNFSLL
tara:strand:- start:138 stop:749 length:612 start_codon:yes stop_codon:yes gene_type:complete